MMAYIEKFWVWLESAKPGEEYEYCCGHFLLQKGETLLVRRAYNEGFVELVQRRLEKAPPTSGRFKGLSYYSWLAIKRKDRNEYIPANFKFPEFLLEGGNQAI